MVKFSVLSSLNLVFSLDSDSLCTSVGRVEATLKTNNLDESERVMLLDDPYHDRSS